MLRAIGVLVLLAFGLTGCRDAPTTSAAAPQHLHAPPLSAAPVRVEPAPRWISEECATVALLRPACPAALPRGDLRFTAAVIRADRRPVSFSVESGAAHPAEPARNRPPGYFHIVVSARHLAGSRVAAWIHPRLAQFRPRDALRADRGRAELVGPRAWSGTSGALVLTVTRELAFRWRVGAAGYEMAIHGWAPFRETAPTLRVLVGRTLARPATEPPRRSPEGSSDGVRFTRTPAWVADACENLRALRAACPRSIPLAVSGAVDAEVLRIHPFCRGGGGTRTILSLEWSAEDPFHPERNRPPGFMHFEVSSGTACLRWRFQTPAVPPRIGMMRGRGFLTSAAVPLGRRTWEGHRGLLVLGDCYGNHLCFRWRAAGTAYQIDLHGWEPFPETVSALRRIVSSAH